MKNIELVATDLDGTFLKDDRSISERNIEALHQLGEKKIVRTVATGRNLRKVKEVLNEQLPFDYIVFSSGAGVFDWKRKKHIHQQNLSADSSRKLLQYFVGNKISFHAFYPVPDNHKHWYFRGERDCEEFERYFNFNNAFAIELDVDNLPKTELCQFLVIIPEDVEWFNKLKAEIETVCKNIRVIRSSSPITPGYIWIEIFHSSVSKGNGVKIVCDHLEVDYKNTVGIGNDYNDFDLLNFTAHSYITNNAPSEILELYNSAPSNENDAFAFVTQPLVE